MADDELKRLMLSFSQLQHKATTVPRLSEKNSVEILYTLLEKKKLQIFVSQNGKDFLTPEKLELEIFDAIHDAGGRLSLLDLSAQLGFSIEVVESKVLELIKDPGKGSHLMLLRGELISQSYLRSLCLEINSYLQESGRLSLSELGETYNLPVDFLTDQIRLRLNSVIYGSLYQQTLYNKSYESRLTAIIRGTLTASLQPVPLMRISTDFRLDENWILKALHGVLAGDCTLQGQIENKEFYPKCYLESQFQMAEAFFKSNNFVAKAWLSRIGIKHPVEFMKKKLITGTLIQDLFVGDSIFSIIKEQITYADKSKSWVDLGPFLPSVLSGEKAKEFLLYILPAIDHEDAKNYRIMEEVIYVSGYFISRLKELCVARIRSLSEIPEASASTSNREGHDDSGVPQHLMPSGDASERFKESALAEIAQEEFGDIWEDFPCGAKEELLADMRVLLAKIFQDQSSRYADSNVTQLNEKYQQWCEEAQTKFERLHLQLKALEVLEFIDDISDSKAILEAPCQHFYKTSVMELVWLLLKLNFYNISGIALEVNSQNLEHAMQSIREKGGSTGIYTEIMALLDAKKAKPIVESILAAYGEASVMLRKPNKKRLNRLISEQSRAALDSLFVCSSVEASDVFYYALQIMILKTHDVSCLMFPNEKKYVAALWKKLKYLSSNFGGDPCLQKMNALWELLLENHAGVLFIDIRGLRIGTKLQSTCPLYLLAEKSRGNTAPLAVTGESCFDNDYAKKQRLESLGMELREMMLNR